LLGDPQHLHGRALVVFQVASRGVVGMRASS
jgi:hypothetical protein